MKKQASNKKPSDSGKSKPKKSALSPKRDSHDEEQMNKYKKQHLYNEDDDEETSSDDEPFDGDLKNLDDFDKYDDDDDDDY